MSRDPVCLGGLIWATRGRAWGFRFLLDAGLKDPLSKYERAFTGFSDGLTAWRREGAVLALRFPDPLGRRDVAGRVIPHEFVVFDDLGDTIRSVDEGVQRIWPLVDDAYARIWDTETAPSVGEIVFNP